MTNEPHTRAGSSRSTASGWAGVALCAGAVLYMAAVISYLIVHGPPASASAGQGAMAEAAANLLENWSIVRTIWLIEMAAALLMAIAGFILRGREPALSVVPARFAWTTAGVGALMLALMSGFITGAYRPALELYSERPELFESLNGAATIWFQAGTAVLLLGFAGAFLAEASAQDRLAPRWVALPGAVAAGVGAVMAAGSLMGLGAVAAIGGAAIFIALPLAGALGVLIWRRERGGA